MLKSSGAGEGTQTKEWCENIFVTTGQHHDSFNGNSQASFILIEISIFVLHTNSDQESLKCMSISTIQTGGQICLYFHLVNEP